MRLAEERRHVVFAMREEGDVAHQHHVGIALDLGEDARQLLVGVFAIAGKNSS